MRILNRPWFRYTLLLLWMVTIFWASATPDLRAVPLAQRFGFLPAMLGEQAARLLELVLRKSAHMLSFGILALLARFALAGSFARFSPRQLAGWAFAIAAAYAASDEWHQTFVPTRQGTVTDVMIDAAGAALALLLVRHRAKGYTGARETVE